MAKSAGEKKRDEAIAKTTRVRDALLNAQMVIPTLVSELNELLEMLKPEEKAEDDEEG